MNIQKLRNVLCRLVILFQTFGKKNGLSQSLLDDPYSGELRFSTLVYLSLGQSNIISLFKHSKLLPAALCTTIAYSSKLGRPKLETFGLPLKIELEFFKSARELMNTTKCNKMAIIGNVDKDNFFYSDEFRRMYGLELHSRQAVWFQIQL